MENKVIFTAYEDYNLAMVLISKDSCESTTQNVISAAEEVGYKKLAEDNGNYFLVIKIEFASVRELKNFHEKIRPYCYLQ